MTVKAASQEDLKNIVDVEEKAAESPKPEENRGQSNKKIAKLPSLEESEEHVVEEGKVDVPLRPEQNYGEPKAMATKPASQGESENTMSEEREGAVSSKPEVPHEAPKETATMSTSQGESGKTLDDERKVAVPSGSVSTVDGERKGGESTGKNNDANESSNTEANTKNKPPFERIVLLGERHSGTSYTTRVLKRCFPSLFVDDFLIRFKHWFQPDVDFVANITKQYLTQKGVRTDVDMIKIVNRWPKIAALDDPKSMAFNETLVIVIFRNAYDWLEAMKEGPHHWSNHFKSIRHNKADGALWYSPNMLPWKEFVAANMTLGATGAGVSQLCQNAYAAGTVSPCVKSKETYPPGVKKDYGSNLTAAPDKLPWIGHLPIYELDSNGKPFRHPLELRTAKIKNFLDIPNKWDLGSYMILQHEEINNEGTGSLLERVSKIVGMKPSCEADPPKRQPSKKLDDEWTKWISEHADWETEAKVGYQRRPGAQPERKMEPTKSEPGSTSKNDKTSSSKANGNAQTIPA
jgi:hypothetical protein